MRLLRLLLFVLWAGLLAFLTPVVLLLVFGFQDTPLVSPPASAEQNDIGRIKTLLQRHDPRNLRDGETRTLTISERDLNLALRAALPAPEWQRGQVSLSERGAALHYTLRVSGNPLGQYLNVSLHILEKDGVLGVQAVEVGELALPGWSVAPLLVLADGALRASFEEYVGVRDAVRAVALHEGRTSITYRWDRTLAKRLEQRGREAVLPAADRERAVAFYRELSRVSATVGRRASLERLLQPLFVLARARSGDGDAAAENRALLLVLGTVLNRSSMHRLVGGDPADLGRGHYYVRWTLHERHDLAQHFAVSAAIAAAGNPVLADAIGVFKELDDSRGGSGFSFADLLADRAGVELAAAAAGADAGRIQGLMAAESLREADFMPPIDQLPEGLQELEFRQRYRNLDDPRYARLKGEIDTRIARLPLHQKGDGGIKK